MRLTLLLLAFMLAPMAGAVAQPPPAPLVQVMVLGSFHMANPGADLHNLAADDVLAPRRQGEIAAVTDALARFKPDKVAVEESPDEAPGLYRQYLAGTLPPSRSEMVQLGFKTAKAAGAEGVFGIDADGDFPYPAVKAFAEAHGMRGLLDQENASLDRRVADEQAILAHDGVATLLRRLNDPPHLSVDNATYRTMLHVGAGKEQPGAELLAGWYRRNFLICANLLQLAEPGDHVLVVFGAGHAFLLRQCVSETPGFELVEPNTYLPG